jgi:hypothetical protein
MNTEIFIPLAAFAGLFIGVLLAYVSPEEMSPGKRYFKWLEKLVIVVTAGGLLVFTKMWWPALLGLVLGFLLRAVHVFLGTAMATSFLFSPASSIFVGSMVFLHGLPDGTRMKATGHFNAKSIIKVAAAFFIPFGLLLLKNISAAHVLSLAAGCLIPQLLGKRD